MKLFGSHGEGFRGDHLQLHFLHVDELSVCCSRRRRRSDVVVRTSIFFIFLLFLFFDFKLKVYQFYLISFFIKIFYDGIFF